MPITVAHDIPASTVAAAGYAGGVADVQAQQRQINAQLAMQQLSQAHQDLMYAKQTEAAQKEQQQAAQTKLSVEAMQQQGLGERQSALFEQQQAMGGDERNDAIWAAHYKELTALQGKMAQSPETFNNPSQKEYFDKISKTLNLMEKTRADKSYTPEARLAVLAGAYEEIGPAPAQIPEISNAEKYEKKTFTDSETGKRMYFDEKGEPHPVDRSQKTKQEIKNAEAKQNHDEEKAAQEFEQKNYELIQKDCERAQKATEDLENEVEKRRTKLEGMKEKSKDENLRTIETYKYSTPEAVDDQIEKEFGNRRKAARTRLEKAEKIAEVARNQNKYFKTLQLGRALTPAEKAELEAYKAQGFRGYHAGN